jgi:RNA polymerase sigma-70 factor, ECF subfamily
MAPESFGNMATDLVSDSGYTGGVADGFSEPEMMVNDEARDFERLLGEMRPKLHRYCARMVGFAIDGEDIVQDALMKAFAARSSVGVLDNPRAWLFRIAHNAALDFLRRRMREPLMEGEEDLDMIAAPDTPDPEIAAMCLQSFMRLPTLQRGAVILKDVLGHSLDETAAIVGTSETAVKSALQRGRERLRALAKEPEDIALPAIDGAARARLVAYVDGFKVGDFDAVRAMLAEDVRLDLVAKLKRSGKNEVGEYFSRYAASEQWMFLAGLVEGRAAMLVFDRDVSLDTPAYFVVIEFDGDRVVAIRDFLFARYAMEGIEIRVIAGPFD